MIKKDWIKFFDLLKEIVNDERHFEEKVKELVDEAIDLGATTELDEFFSWSDLDLVKESL